MSASDPYNLHRFIEAQADEYMHVLSELRAGQKQSHWMWFIFPQFMGLGSSATSQHFAIGSVAEAGAYLSHPLLGARLIECCETVLAITGRSAHDIFGSPDDVKLRSCATLFASVSAPGSLFEQVLDTYFDGTPDLVTLELIRPGRGTL